jgi:predicted AlkP superfamily pyrophosphatase or phosphodiesterase
MFVLILNSVEKYHLQSVTFPNHWSLVTGLYPESHGIVGNEFIDRELNDTFFYKDPARSWDSKWWKGEPIWVTSVLQNKRSAVLMWPGSNTKVHNEMSTYHIPYSSNYTTIQKADVILNWLDMPRDQRPQLMTMYVPQVDSIGHRQGPYGQGVSIVAHGHCTAFEFM